MEPLARQDLLHNLSSGLPWFKLFVPLLGTGAEVRGAEVDPALAAVVGGLVALERVVFL